MESKLSSWKFSKGGMQNKKKKAASGGGGYVVESVTFKALFHLETAISAGSTDDIGSTSVTSISTALGTSASGKFDNTNIAGSHNNFKCAKADMTNCQEAFYNDDDWMLDFWLNRTGVNSEAVFEVGAITGGMKLEWDTGKLKTTVNFGGAGLAHTESAATTGWRHIRLIYNQSENKLRLFIDGVLEHTFAWDSSSNACAFMIEHVFYITAAAGWLWDEVMLGVPGVGCGGLTDATFTVPDRIWSP